MWNIILLFSHSSESEHDTSSNISYQILSFYVLVLEYRQVISGVKIFPKEEGFAFLNLCFNHLVKHKWLSINVIEHHHTQQRYQNDIKMILDWY